MDYFGEVRDILSKRPTVRAWNRLCEMLDALTETERNQVAIPYCRHHLETNPRWERLKRVPPKAWMEKFLKEKKFFPSFSLISHFDIEWHSEEERDALLDVLVASKDLDLLRSLNLSQCYLKNDGVIRLLNQGEHLFQKLRGLKLYYNQIGLPGVKAIASCDALAGLEMLDLAGNTSIGIKGLEALAASESLKNLKWLNLSNCNFSESQTATNIVEESHWPSSVKSNWKNW